MNERTMWTCLQVCSQKNYNFFYPRSLICYTSNVCWALFSTHCKNTKNYTYQHLPLTIFRLHSSISISFKMDFVAISVIFYGHFRKCSTYEAKRVAFNICMCCEVCECVCVVLTQPIVMYDMLEFVHIARIQFICSILRISYHCKWSHYHSDRALVFAFQNCAHTLFTCDRKLFRGSSVRYIEKYVYVRYKRIREL